jgi:ketosteroid isomerase-like protein
MSLLNTENNKKVVLTFIEAMGRGDAAAAAPCIAEDTFTLAKGFGKFAGVRTHDTILATIAAFRQLMPAGMEPVIHSVTAEGDRVVVEFEGNGTLINGESYCNQYCMVFMLRGGRIRQVNEYFCTILADEKLWPLVAGMTL